jgi:hypothetical protein
MKDRKVDNVQNFDNCKNNLTQQFTEHTAVTGKCPKELFMKICSNMGKEQANQISIQLWPFHKSSLRN